MTKIYEEAEKAINQEHQGEWKQIMKLSEYYEETRKKTAAHLLHYKDTEDARIHITFDKDTLKINEYGKKRIGCPKNTWYKFALNELWTTSIKSHTEQANTTFNPGNQEQNK